MDTLSTDTSLTLHQCAEEWFPKLPLASQRIFLELVQELPRGACIGQAYPVSTSRIATRVCKSQREVRRHLTEMVRLGAVVHVGHWWGLCLRDVIDDDDA